MQFHETPIKVRFNEVDAYRVAWHGHYVTWMEVGRGELAGLFGLDADQLAAEGYLAPVVTLEVQYKRPLRYGEEARVLTTLKRSETATLEFRCRILGADGTVAATGRTVHALTDLAGELQYRIPPVIEERLERLFSHLEG
ncbi:MAG TPA: acyl-CoA thioesterase [Geobacteraceae bacterium]